MSGRYFARNGDEITLEQWSNLLGNREYKVVKQEYTDKGTLVSTVWLGLDHGNPFVEDPIPLFFETMVFSNTETWDDDYMDRYPSEESALEGHERIANMVRELEAVDGTARPTDPAPGEPRPAAAERDVHPAQHTIGPEVTGE
jgi:hypothetical protein